MVRFGGAGGRSPQVTLPFAKVANYPHLAGQQLHRREADRQVERPRPHPDPARARTPSSCAASTSTPSAPCRRRTKVAKIPRRAKSPDKRAKVLSTRYSTGPSSSPWWAPEVGRPAADQPHRPGREGDVELPQLGAGAGAGRQRAGGRVRARHRHGRRQHVHSTARRTSSRSAARRKTGPRRRRKCSSACGSAARSATTTRSRSGAQDDYYGLAAFFARTRHEEQPGVRACSAARRWCSYAPAGEVNAPADPRRREAARHSTATRKCPGTTRSTAARSSPSG